MERRRFLHHAQGLIAATATATAAAGCAASPQGAASAPRVPTIVLVHGAWHGAQHWNGVVAALAGMGRRALAIDLPGHGLYARFPAAFAAADRSGMATEPSPVRGLTLDDAADAVIRTLHAVRGGEHVTLVGHSMAGSVITRVGERAPELVDRLVYLAAYVPVRLPSAADYHALPESKTEHFRYTLLGDSAAIGAVRIDPRSSDVAYLAHLRATFYGDVDEATFRAFAYTLTPDLPLDFFAGRPGATRERWGRIPRTYLRTAHDGALAPPLQDLLIREADAFTPGNRFETATLASSHSPFASQPAPLARLLAAQI